MLFLKKRVRSLFWSFMVVFLISGVSQATVYFDYDAEAGILGEELPHNQSSGPEFCGPECSGEGNRSTHQIVGGTPDGTKYFVFETVDNQGNAYTEVKNKGVFPIPAELGRTYYLAYFMNFERIAEKDIWHEGTNVQSGDKGIELRGDGLRWVTSRGQWDSYIENQDHQFTVWVGNPSYHINPNLEHSDAYYQNQNGYSSTNPIQLEYEKWYSVVMGVKVACNNTGSVSLWINGELLLKYENIQTVATCSPSISLIEMGGTMSQPAYDAPAHHRKFDALFLTDNWQDIVDGGYLAGAPPDTGGSFSSPENVDTTISWPISGQ